ncbi:MAG: PilZ domain-containing protein [Nitrospira sp.]|nr:PilZ domain-containing protein [Nitrospira sp.]
MSVRYSASVQTDTGAGEGVLLDLSATGCRLQSDVALTPGSYLALHIEASETEVPLAIEVSRVRWSNAGEFGIEFLRYAQGNRQRVTALTETLSSHQPSARHEHTESALTTVAA